MDKLQKLYWENKDPHDKIKKILEKIHGSINATSILLLQFELLMPHQETKDLIAEMNHDQLEILGRLEDYFERYWPGMFSKK
jgi:hypothetical protein